MTSCFDAKWVSHMASFTTVRSTTTAQLHTTQFYNHTTTVLLRTTKYYSRTTEYNSVLLRCTTVLQSDSKMYEMSFNNAPSNPNTKRLPWPSVTAKPLKCHFQCAEQPCNKTTVTKCHSNTYETSFPMRRATMGLPNTIRLRWPSVTANAWNVIFKARSNPGIAKRKRTAVTKCHSNTYETSFPMRGATMRLPNAIRLWLWWTSVKATSMKRQIQCARLIWAWSKHDPRMNRQSATRRFAEVPFRVSRRRFVWKKHSILGPG